MSSEPSGASGQTHNGGDEGVVGRDEGDGLTGHVGGVGLEARGVSQGLGL